MLKPVPMAKVAIVGPKTQLEKTVETVHGVWHLVRITPYRREGASDRGLVVTILDVSALHRAESAPGGRNLSAK